MNEREKATPSASPAATTTPKRKQTVHEAPEPDEIYRLAGLAPHRVADLPATIDLGEQPSDRAVYLDVARLVVRDGFSGTGEVTPQTIHEDAIGGPKTSLDFVPSPLLLGIGPGDDMLRVKFRASRPGRNDVTLSVRIDWSDGLRTSLTTKLVVRVPKSAAKPAPGSTSPPLQEGSHAAERSPIHEGEHKSEAPAAPPKWRLALPDTIAFEEVDIGRVTTMQTHVFHLDHPGNQGPRIAARVIGEDGVTLLKAPTFLPGAAQTPNDAEAFKLSYRRRPGRPKGALEIEILDMPQEKFRIPFSVGFPEIERRARERAAEEAADMERHAQGELEMKARAEEYYDRNPRERFDSIAGLVSNALGQLSIAHVNGVGNAEAEALAFTRRVPPNKPSLVLALAGAALEIGFSAVAGGIAKRMEPALKAAFQTHENGMADFLLGLVTDGFKQSIKTSGAAASAPFIKASASRSQGEPKLPPQPGDSSNPLIAFFGQQRDRISATDTDRRDGVVTSFRGALLPDFEPGKPPWQAKRANQIMQGLRDGIKEETLEARKKQAQHSAEAWVRYVAESSSENSLDEPHRRFDGLIDLQAGAMRSLDGRITLRGARVLGVSQSIVRRLLGGRLDSHEVPLRLVIEVGGAREEETVTILRDAKGNVTIRHHQRQRSQRSLLAGCALTQGQPDA